MRYSRTVGFIAINIVALVALFGADSASATLLCSTPNETAHCASTSAYPQRTVFHAVLDEGAGPAKLKTPFKTIECKKSTIQGETSNEGSATETVLATELALTFEECNCVVSVLELGTLELHHVPGTDHGLLTATGAEVTTSCSTPFGNVHCRYVTSNTSIGTLTGGNHATLDAEANIPQMQTSALCASEALWTAKYDVTSPGPMYVSDGT